MKSSRLLGFLLAGAMLLLPSMAGVAYPMAAASPGWAAPPKGGLVDINSASEEELDALPGIGPVMARKIIAGRPYRAKTDLRTRNIIPQSAYDKIKDQIIAHQVKK